MPDRAHPRAEGRRLRGTLAVLLALTVAACSGDDSGAAAGRDATSSTRRPTSTATDSTTTSSSMAAPGSAVADPLNQQIIDRYIGYWDARRAANTGTPNPDHPGLREFATGEQLTAVIEEARSNLEKGLAFRPSAAPINFRQVRVVSIDGDSAVVQECYVDDGVVYRSATGEVVDDSVTSQNVRGELQRVDGKWRVSRTRLAQWWEGVDGCARAT